MPENQINSPNISNDEIKQIGGGEIYSLSIGTLLEFNLTYVECVALFFHGTPPQFSPAVALLIQGFLNVHVLMYNSVYDRFVNTVNITLLV